MPSRLAAGRNFLYRVDTSLVSLCMADKDSARALRARSLPLLTICMLAAFSADASAQTQAFAAVTEITVHYNASGFIDHFSVTNADASYRWM